MSALRDSSRSSSRPVNFSSPESRSIADVGSVRLRVVHGAASAGAMNPEEQTVTWLIALGVLNSPKKNIADPEEFLKASLRDGVVLCKLMERLLPGSVPKFCSEPRHEADCVSNIRDFLKGCSALKIEGFEPEDLYTGENFGKVLTTLLAVNIATQDCGTERSCPQSSSPAPSQSSSTATQSKSSRLQLRRQSKPVVEMAENGGGSGSSGTAGQLVVKARFNFKQNNEDELSFSKGELIHVTRQEDGGWWEGTLNGKTGWFPSNYVREVKPCDKPISPKAIKGFDVPQLTKNYYSVVVQDILDHEREFIKELQAVLSCYLRPLQASDKLSAADSASLIGNLEEILTFQQGLCVTLEECTKLPEGQQRLGSCYLNLMCQIRTLYLSYCSGHPTAVSVLTDHSEELDKFMEAQGAPGVLSLTTSLSRPFLRLDKYPTLLQELERHVEEAHPDYSDILKATATFKSLVMQCQDLRKRKNLELQILSEPVRGWEGDGMKALGQVAYMSQVYVQTGGHEDKEERYLMLFTNVLVMLSASPRMSGFIYQSRLSLTGTTVTKQIEDVESNQYAFEITGGAIDRVTVFCSSQQELQEWLEHLLVFSKGGSPVGTIVKNVDGKQSVGTPVHPGHTQSFSAPVPSLRGALEPPRFTKPWSLSCLRPAPPLKPSAALGYKEDSSKSPRPIKKFLPKRKTERKPSDDEFLLRKSTAALEEDAQILKVIEAYCTGASMHQTTTAVRKECIPQVLLPEEEKIIVEEMKSNGQTVMEENVTSPACCRSLVDAVYALKDEVHELKKENKWMKQCLEEEQKSRKELERVVRKLAKQKNDCSWEETSH
ncbi:rho guanine nucleotide exchange factor 6 isoform X2 [Denticeps clupeoides]|uniref:Rac/Cdc42 guanine nucleotide exchange factor (GEF) 6 n=1 Tax=Denticeps clupeoides TaxID=299321 RepID=A0AAY4CMJ6_9TELE|nr:rho guanine nucleotide exchange factor 6 isoform X2 [Denticeps clupeoides]